MWLLSLPTEAGRSEATGAVVQPCPEQSCSQPGQGTVSFLGPPPCPAQPGVLHPWPGAGACRGAFPHLHSPPVNTGTDLGHSSGRVLSEAPIWQPQDPKAGVRNWLQSRGSSVPACSQSLCDTQSPRLSEPA